MKPKYEMGQMVIYWSGDVGRDSEVHVAKVSEIHQTEEGVEYKLLGVFDNPRRLIDERNLHEDVESVTEAIDLGLQGIRRALVMECETRWAKTQGTPR